MLAYVFWHTPAEGVDAAAYEARLVAFHESLAAAAPPGFRGSAALPRTARPWADAYEDWYLVDDWAALGTLNDAAVRSPHRGTHDDVAHRAAWGAGGVYALKRGDPAFGTAAWSYKPRGSSDADHIDSLEGTVWQRQLVLGPAPEFCATAPGDVLYAVVG